MFCHQNWKKQTQLWTSTSRIARSGDVVDKKKERAARRGDSGVVARGVTDL